MCGLPCGLCVSSLLQEGRWCRAVFLLCSSKHLLPSLVCGALQLLTLSQVCPPSVSRIPSILTPSSVFPPSSLPPSSFPPPYPHIVSSTTHLHGPRTFPPGGPKTPEARSPRLSRNSPPCSVLGQVLSHTSRTLGSSRLSRIFSLCGVLGQVLSQTSRESPAVQGHYLLPPS